MKIRQPVARDVASRAGQFTVELVLAVIGATILVLLSLGYELSSGALVGAAALIVTFGIPLLASFVVAKYVRRRLGSNVIAKATTSLIMAYGLYTFASGASRLLAFYGPFLGAEFENAKEWGGYGPIEAVPYVLEGVVWSYDTVRIVFPDAARSFELGATVLVVGVVLELSRYGISRKVKA